MTPDAPALLTPIYLKTSAEMSWPDDKAFFLVASNGLFLCRNHPLFRSCVPARHWPSELAPQDERLTPLFPKVPQAIIEAVVAFFARVAELHHAEAAALLAWDQAAGNVRLIIPHQRCTVEETWRGNRYPVGVHYDAPAQLAGDLILMGDIHSHADMPAYASYTDRADEDYRAGLHIVVGRVDLEPPDFHAEAAVDGIRFRLDTAQVIERYVRRRPHVPNGWFDRLTIDVLPPYNAWPAKPAKPAPRQAQDGLSPSKAAQDQKWPAPHSGPQPAGYLPEPRTPVSKPETRDSKLETLNPNLEPGHWKPER